MQGGMETEPSPGESFDKSGNRRFDRSDGLSESAQWAVHRQGQFAKVSDAETGTVNSEFAEKARFAGRGPDRNARSTDPAVLTIGERMHRLLGLP